MTTGRINQVAALFRVRRKPFPERFAFSLAGRYFQRRGENRFSERHNPSGRSGAEATDQQLFHVAPLKFLPKHPT